MRYDDDEAISFSFFSFFLFRFTKGVQQYIFEFLQISYISIYEEDNPAGFLAQL